MYFLQRLLLTILSSLIFYYVLNYVEPPKSWPEASTFQILIFFLPLLSAITFFLNIFLCNILRSFVVSLGVIFALVLLAIKQLTPLTAALTFFVTGIIFVYTPTIRYFHTRKLRKIAHLSKDNHHKNQEKPQRVLKKL